MARQPLRPAQQQYSAVDEDLFRQQVINFMNEITNKVDLIEELKTTKSAKSVRRHQFMMLGAPNWTG
jgi:ABC-type transporter lipoprotein component MlaA|tara:strand:+ start:628 stop:828 length:201 start_codon:yes stop_codon:yes gene_type:complete